MLICVASDSHGARRDMDLLLARLPKVDAFVFLGDMERDGAYLDYGVREVCPGADFYAVCGNNDPFSQLPVTVTLGFEGTRVMVTHGHVVQQIRTSTRYLVARAKALGCGMALYGHTHVARDMEEDGVRVVNPGALMQGEYALVRFAGTDVDVELLTLR